MRMLNAIPALPVKNIEQSAAFYRDKLDFSIAHQAAGFAILRRDAVEIHLWAANDERWKTRRLESPVISGAESFIAGTASCRVGVEGVHELYEAARELGIVHPNGHLEQMPWGTREFGAVDPDNNLITFFERKG